MPAPTQKLYLDSSPDASAPPVTFTGNELRDKEFPPIKWAVPDLLPAGVTLFGGREKMGKSWLGFSLGIAVATGGYALGKVPVEQGDALYLSLEDPERRLYERIRRLAREDTDLAHFHYTTEWNPLTGAESSTWTPGSTSTRRAGWWWETPSSASDRGPAAGATCTTRTTKPCNRSSGSPQSTTLPSS